MDARRDDYAPPAEDRRHHPAGRSRAVALLVAEAGAAFRVTEWVTLVLAGVSLVAILARPQAPRMPKIVGGLGSALIIAGVGSFIALTGTASINLAGLAAVAVGFIALLAYLFLPRA